MGSIYFIQPVRGGLIKIGYTTQPVAERAKELQSGSPLPLRVLGWWTGDTSEESTLHTLFQDSWAYGEWFKSSMRLTDLIERRRLAPPFNVELPGNWSVSRKDAPGLSWVAQQEP